MKPEPIKSAMLMAAGLGVRLQPYTLQIPKAFIPVMGIPAIQFSIDRLADAGVEEVVINVHHLVDEARKRIDSLDKRGMQVHVSDESSELLGSAGGIRTGREQMKFAPPFYVLNADVLFPIDLRALSEVHFQMRKDLGTSLTMAVHESGVLSEAYGEVFFSQDRRQISGTGPKKKNVPFYLGACVMEDSCLKNTQVGEESDFLEKILEPGIQKGVVAPFFYQEFWADLGKPELWREAHFQLIEAFEQKNIPPSWISRITQENERIDQGVWVRRGRPVPKEVGSPSYTNSIESEVGSHEVVYEFAHLSRTPRAKS